MMKRRITKVILTAAAVASSGLAVAGDYDEIIDVSRPVGIRTYDVGDYVQTGLVSHFDGIRNAGADKPHDSSAIVWSDLARDGHVANFFTTTVDTEKHAPTPCYDGRWTKDGYVFPGHVYAQMDETIAPGSCITVQLALDVDVNQQTTANPTYIGMVEDHGFFTSGKGATVHWKFEAYGGSRPCFQNWEGKYLTGILDTGKIYVFQEAVRANGADRTKTVEIPANKWSFGGPWNTGLGFDWSGPRYAVGEIKNVRFYNRALTDEELQQNRRIDDFRFNGAYNVEVASTVPGASGAEDVGLYEVNGHHDFTADRALVGDVEYAAIGYAVEVWNAEKAAWGKQEEHAETTYAYTNCAATAKVRLTWIWKPVRGLVKYDVTTYAQQGLVLNFDGISNQGVGQPHSVNAAVWANCGPADATAVITKLAVGEKGGWTARGYDFLGGEYALIEPELDLGDKITVQVVSEFEPPRQPKLQGPSSTTDQNTYPTLFGNPNDRFNVYTVSQELTLTLKADAVVGPYRGACQYWQGQFANAFLDYDGVDLRADDSSPVWVQGERKDALGAQSWRFGGNPVGSLDGDKARRNIIGTMFAVRAYDRVLTSYELARNRAVDRVRFYDALPNGSSSNGVMIVTGVPGIEGNEPCGFYEVLGDAYTFSAAGDEKVFGGKTCRIVGFTLERMNPASGHWELETDSDELSCTYTPGATQLYRRLTWKVQVVHGLKKASDYTTADYVQTGLISMFDGISNRGADVPHDSGTLRWKDLARPDRYANFYTTTKDASLHSQSLCYDGVWSKDGYQFPGHVYARMDAPIAPGANLTIQLALDATVGEQKSNYPTWAGLVEDHGFFTSAKGATVQWKFEAYGGNRPSFPNWQGKYLTGILDTDKIYVFQEAMRANGADRTKTVEVPANMWSLASAWNTGFGFDWAGPRYATGEYKCARFYNRALTDAELAQNRKVDEIRFRGAVVTNVVVSTPFAGVSGNEPDGVYEVEGSWTFTASAHCVEGHKVVPTGYGLRRLVDGMWSDEESFSGAAYTYDAAKEKGPVMLVWQFAQPGMSIIIR